MKNQKKQLLYLLTLALCAFSCTKEPLGNPEQDIGKKVEVRLHLSMSAPDVPTYALTDKQESNVNNVYVFFFNKSSGTVYDVVEGKKVTNVSDTEKTFTATLVIDGNTSTIFESYVVANISTFMAGNAKAEFIGKTYTQLQLFLKTEVKDKLHTTEGNIVMWGKADSDLPSTNTLKTIKVPMIRALARVDIGVGENGAWNGKDKDGQTINFSLTTVHIYKPNNGYTFMPLEASYYDVNTKKVTSHSAIGTAIPKPMVYEVGGIKTVKDIYLPESNVRMTDTGSTGDANHTLRCAIVVGGKYNGSEADSYYRIDFNDNTTKRNLINILRNHRYSVNIISVTGEGYPTADDAYNATTSSIQADITEWSDISQDIVFDGANWVYVQKKSLSFPGSKDVIGNLVVGSNMQVADWYMSFDGETFSTDATISNADFEVTKPSVSDGGVLVIKTLNTITDDLPRTALLHLKIGRLKFTISLLQSPDAPTDWEDGIEYPKEF